MSGDQGPKCVIGRRNSKKSIDIAPDDQTDHLQTAPSGRHPKLMSKTQIRELKAILVVFANRLRRDRLDDPMRILAYRAQSLVDEAMRSANEPVRKAG